MGATADHERRPGGSGPDAALRPRDFGIGRLCWTMHEAVVVANADTGRVVLWNPAAERLFGCPAAEVADSGASVGPERFLPRLAESLERFRTTSHDPLLDAPGPHTLVGRRRDGGEVTVEATVSQLESEDSAQTPGRHILVLMRAATERAVLEAERTAKAKLEGALLVARTVAHELNNALSPVVGYSELLGELPTVARDPHAATYVRLITDGATEAVRRIQRLQRIARLEEDTGPLGPALPVLDLHRSTVP